MAERPETDGRAALIPFADLRMVGGRFDQPGLPLDVSKDLDRYGTMIVEVAKSIWRERNPGRRLPAGFAEQLDLRLTGVEPGSVIPVIERRGAAHPNDAPHVADLAKQRVDEAFEQIVAGNFEVVDSLPAPARKALVRFGSSLRPRELFHFRAASDVPILYDRATRRRYLARREGDTVDETGLVVGTVRALDSVDQTFKLVLPGEANPIPGHFEAPELYDVLHEAQRQENDALIRLQCLYSATRDGLVVQVKDVDTAEPFIVPEQACGKRLIELATLDRGWLDGEVGERVDLTALEAAAEVLQWLQDEKYAMPFVYPTVEGWVQIEWHDLPDHLEVVLSDLLAYEVFRVSADGQEESWPGRGVHGVKDVLTGILGGRL